MDTINGRAIILGLVLASCVCAPGFAESPEALFKQGNKAFTESRFKEAAEAYEAARTAGLRHWMLEFNLGSAYYRMDQNGKAVAHYWRAFRLNSGDRDVLYNLQLATTRANDPALPASALAAFFWRLFFSASLNTLAFFTSLFFFLLCGAGLLWMFGDRRLSTEGLAVLSSLFLIFGSWLGARWWAQSQPIAIVTVAAAEVRSGPNVSYTANFTIPEGRRVMVLKEQEPIPGWLEVGVSQEGLKGWVPDSSVEVL